MKRYVFAALWLAMFLVVHETGLLMCKDQKELPPEDRDPRFYVDGKDGIRHYVGLMAHGDYTKLKLIIRSKKADYNQGEFVYIRFLVRNESDGEVHICRLPSTYYCAHLWKLFHSNFDEVSKTPKLEKKIQEHKRSDRYGFEWGGESGYNYLKLKPGQEVELDWKSLNDLFDLSKPDTYELTCFDTSFIQDQEYQPPLQSNTLTFRVLEEPVAKNYWLRDGVTRRKGEPQDVPYTNPPPGQEVFKQPKPPKNVFYDASQPPDPAKKPSVYRGWEKEQAAQAAKPPDEVKPSKE